MTITRVNHTGVGVSDMKRSLTFYRDLLELDVIFDSDVLENKLLSSVVGVTNARGRVVWLRAGDTMIELWEWDNPVGRELASDYNPSDKGVTLRITNRQRGRVVQQCYGCFLPRQHSASRSRLTLNNLH
jgi:catechol 2,3-dioxygenase-like lactoylglutathione lyase family enzyme